MRIILTGLTVLVVMLSACSKEHIEASLQEISIADLNSSVVNAVEENYPDAEITSAYKVNQSDADFLIEIDGCEMLAFTQNGAEVENAMALRKGKGGPRGGGGHHGGGPGHGGGHGGGGVRDTVPAVIKSYIDVNFPNDSILGARRDSSCQFGNVLNVFVTDGTSRPRKLGFSSTNQYLYTATRVSYQNGVSQAAKDTISSVYANYLVRRVSEKYVLANNTITYNVFLHAMRNRKLVSIKDDGTIICVR